jgi:secretory phospholipase A2
VLPVKTSLTEEEEIACIFQEKKRQRKTMEYLWILLSLFIVISSAEKLYKNPKQQKGLKALWNLEEMAECQLGYTALDYNNYGCWCGVGGAGEPLDGIDECCMNHDKCYDSAIDDGACYDVPFEYVEDYSWTCQRMENGKKVPNCTEHQNACKAELCWCDRMVVECWGGYGKPITKLKCPHPRVSKQTSHSPFHSIFTIWTASLESLRRIASIFW